MPEEKKSEIEDIFADLDQEDKKINKIPEISGSVKKEAGITPQPSLTDEKVSEAGTKNIKNKYLIIIIIVLVVVGLILGTAVIYWKFFRSSNELSNFNEMVSNNSIWESNVNSNQSADLDTDTDGLIDQEEINFGTDPNNPDTDYDGLSDLGEKVFKTDPHAADTDGDGYKDGEEIKKGYNPNGSGELLDLNQALQNLNT